MKTCEHCGESYAKRPKEAYWQFNERKFCSRACANRGRRTTRVHKTKRARAQTCGPECKSALLSRRNAERKEKAA